MKDFDELDALERTAGDRNLLVAVIRFTLEDIPALLDEIDLALKNRHWHDAARLAHKAKGSAGAVGAQRLFMAAMDLELAARDADSTCIRFQSPLVEAFESFRSHPLVRRMSSLDAGGEASIG